MITSTLSVYPGKKIVKDLGIIFAYDETIRATRFMMDGEQCLEAALEYLAKKAEKRGANAVMGISFDLRDPMKPILMGTAVVLEDK